MSLVKLMALTPVFMSGLVLAEEPRNDCERRVEYQFVQAMQSYERTKADEDFQCRTQSNFMACFKYSQEKFNWYSSEAKKWRETELGKCR